MNVDSADKWGGEESSGADERVNEIWGTESAGANEQVCRKGGWQAKTTNRTTSADKLVGLTCTCASLWVGMFAFGADEWGGDQSTGADELTNEQSRTLMSVPQWRQFHIRVYIFEAEISTYMYWILYLVNWCVFHLYRDMILREFLSYQNIRGGFSVSSVRDGVYAPRNFCASFIFCWLLWVCVLTLQRTVSCACGERDGYHGRYAHM